MPSDSKTGVASPCISICSIDDDSGFCRGCWRTAAEVEGWLRYTDPEKTAVLEALKARKLEYPDLGVR